MARLMETLPRIGGWGERGRERGGQRDARVSSCGQQRPFFARGGRAPGRGAVVPLSVFAVSSSSLSYLSRSRLCGSDTGSVPLLRHVAGWAWLDVLPARASRPPRVFPLEDGGLRRRGSSRTVAVKRLLHAARDLPRAVASSRARPATMGGFNLADTSVTTSLQRPERVGEAQAP